MDCVKVGNLIRNLRKEKNMTQKDLADELLISDKTISKWERGLGCPDVSILKSLSDILGVNIEKLLVGSLDINQVIGGNMKRIKFYVCSNCGNVITSTGQSEIACCGRKLEALVENKEDENHQMNIEEIENDYYLTISHEMIKSHFISFVAYVKFDRVLLIKLYPEQDPQIRFPQMSGGKIYIYCNQHGLIVKQK